VRLAVIDPDFDSTPDGTQVGVNFLRVQRNQVVLNLRYDRQVDSSFVMLWAGGDAGKPFFTRECHSRQGPLS